MSDMEPDERQAVRKMAESLVDIAHYERIVSARTLLHGKVADDVCSILKNTEIDYEECVRQIEAVLVRRLRCEP